MSSVFSNSPWRALAIQEPRANDIQLVAASISRKLARLQKGGAIWVFDLCGGAGGFSLGFQAAGSALIGSIENDPQAAATYALNLHKGNDPQLARARDLTVETPSGVIKELGLGRVADAVDVIIAGLPCQAFARIGRPKLGSLAADKEAYRKDPRAALYQRFLVFVRAFMPLAVVLENVPDILNHGDHNVPEEIVRRLEQVGYRCSYTLLNSAYYGVPQLRERLFLMAVHESLGAEPRFPVPTSPDLDPARLCWGPTFCA